MFRRLGVLGVLGALLVTGGLGVVTWRDPLVGVGLSLVLAGVGLVVRSMVQSLVRTLVRPSTIDFEELDPEGDSE